MANAIYPKYKEALLTADVNIDLEAGTVKAILVDTALYTYDAAHDFVNDVAVGARVSTSPALTSKTITNGVFDAADITWTAVSGATIEAIVIFIDTGVEATSRLVAFIDTGQTGLPLTPNGGNVTWALNASGMFAL